MITTAGIYGVEAGRWSVSGMSASASASGLGTGAAAITDSPDETRPGVWTSQDGKLCSLGIHFRRGVSSFGVGFNVDDRVGGWFERIVACGIEGARAVSLNGERQIGRGTGIDGVVGVDDVARTLAGVVADGLQGVEGVEEVDCREVGEMD